jgi:hypothetical protein
MATGLGQYGFGVKNHRYATAGKYFMATNPTPGTGIVSGVVTSLADTTPVLLIKNNNPVASGVKVVLDFLRLHVTVVGVGHTSPKLTLKLDRSQSTTRYTSGGSTITPVCCGGGGASLAQVYFGAITAAASGDAVLLDTFQLKTAIEVVNDTFTVDFGSPTGSIKSALADNSTTISHSYFPTCPVSLDPQQHASLHFWAASNSTGVTFQFSLGYVEV